MSSKTERVLISTESPKKKIGIILVSTETSKKTERAPNFY
jgi:hypothetical protein